MDESEGVIGCRRMVMRWSLRCTWGGVRKLDGRSPNNVRPSLSHNEISLGAFELSKLAIPARSLFITFDAATATIDAFKSVRRESAVATRSYHPGGH